MPRGSFIRSRLGSVLLYAIGLYIPRGSFLCPAVLQFGRVRIYAPGVFSAGRFFRSVLICSKG